MRNFIASLVTIATLVLLTGCDNRLKTSDFRGGFYTQSGSCTETGDVGITLDSNQIEIGFYCFLKECALESGKTSQGGFFHLEQASGHYIQGRIAGYEAKGTWYLNIKGQDCSGHWAALKN